MTTKTVPQDNASLTADKNISSKIDNPKTPTTSGPVSQQELDNTHSSPPSRKVHFTQNGKEKDLQSQNTTSSLTQKNRKTVFEAPSKIKSSSDSDISGSSRPELRNGLRLQKYAYERRYDARGLELNNIFNSRRFSNAYVERLKQFYQYENMFQSYFFPPLWSDRNSSVDCSQYGRNFMSRSFGKLSFSETENSTNHSPRAVNSFRKTQDLPSIRNTNPHISVPQLQNQLSGVTITVTTPSGKTSRADCAPMDKNISGKIKYNKSQKNNNRDDTKNKNQQNIEKNGLKSIVPPNNSIAKSKSDSENPSARPGISDKNFNQSQKVHSLKQTYPPINIPPPVPILITPHTGIPTSTKNSSKPDFNNDNNPESTSTSTRPVDTQSILEAVQRLGLSRRSSNAAGSGLHRYRQQRKRARISRAALEKDSKNVAMKLSLPCSSGCCYCVYASLLGPVKIYMSRGARPKKEPSLLGIKDGNGRPGIPLSRKEDITGLIYDAHNHSFHPPLPPSLPSQSRKSGNFGVSKTRSGPENLSTRKPPFSRAKAAVKR